MPAFHVIQPALPSIEREVAAVAAETPDWLLPDMIRACARQLVDDEPSNTRMALMAYYCLRRLLGKDMAA